MLLTEFCIIYRLWLRSCWQLVWNPSDQTNSAHPKMKTPFARINSPRRLWDGREQAMDDLLRTWVSCVWLPLLRKKMLGRVNLDLLAKLLNQRSPPGHGRRQKALKHVCNGWSAHGLVIKSLCTKQSTGLGRHGTCGNIKISYRGTEDQRNL